MRKITTLFSTLLISGIFYSQTLNPTPSISAGGSANSFVGGYTFSYKNAGTPWHGSLLSFGGFSNQYDTQINADYGPNGGNHISFRTRNAESNNATGLWNPWFEIWHSGNLNNWLSNLSSKNVLVNENVVLRNIVNSTNAGNKIQFNSFNDDSSGPYIKSALAFASGSSSRMSLKMGSYWGGENNELTLMNKRVGINKDNPEAYLHVFIPGNEQQINAFDIDVETFGTSQNLNNSHFLRIRDIGGNETPFIIKASGNVGIGVTSPQNKLDVNGTIHSKEVKVDLMGWADFVFEKDYHLPTLKEVEKHINDKGRLPGMPSEQEVLKDGLSLGENQKLLLQKIEELTLYAIEQDKKINELIKVTQEQTQKIQMLETK